MTNPTVPEQFTNVDSRKVELERHVIIGCGSVILPGVTIGANVAVGALSLVMKDLPADGIYAGRPTKFVKSRSTGLFELEDKYLKSQQDSGTS